MEEATGLVKHVLMAKFKDEITQNQIDQLIKGYANLVTLIEPMKTFHWKLCPDLHVHTRNYQSWGKDVSIENLHLGFTHVFESTFESLEGVAEYISHPAHVEFANEFLTALDKVLVFDYKPTTVNL